MSAYHSNIYRLFLFVVAMLLWSFGPLSTSCSAAETVARAKKTDIVITIIHGKLVRLDPSTGKKLGPVNKPIKLTLKNRLIFTKTLRDDPKAKIGGIQLGSYLDDFLVDMPALTDAGVWYNGDIDYPLGSDAETWRVEKPCTVTIKMHHGKPIILPAVERIDTFIRVRSNDQSRRYVYNPADDTSYLWLIVRAKTSQESQAINQALKSTFGDRVFCVCEVGDGAGLGALPAVGVYGGMEKGYTLNSEHGAVTPEKAIAFIGDLLRKKDTLSPPKPQAPEKIDGYVCVDKKEQAEPFIARLKQVFGAQLKLETRVEASDNDTRHYPAICVLEPERAYAYLDSKTAPLTPEKAVAFMKDVIKKNGLFHPVFTTKK
jgi:hypothetical protein